MIADPVLPNEITDRARQLGPLESPLIWLTAAAWTVAAVTVAVCLWRNRRARRWSLTGAGVFFLVAAITAVNTYVGYVRTPDDLGKLLQKGGGVLNAAGRFLDDGKNDPEAPTPVPGASVSPPGTPPKKGEARTETVTLADPPNKIPAGQNLVLLPPGYFDPENANRRYPVVYLVHGYPFGGPRDWLTSGDAPGSLDSLGKAKLISPMIVVSVDMTAGQPSQDWEGLNIPGGPQLENYLANTVVPAIDQRYRTVNDRSGRALGGMSGGGFAALNIGLHHVQQFGTLIIALPYDDLNNSISVLGGDQAAIRADTPRQYLPTMDFPAPVAVMLAVGSGAPTDVTTAKRIADALHARGQEAVVHVERGFNHTWHTARATLPYLLVFADQHFHSPGSAAGPSTP
ncbi:Enterochelin esterase [Amycolatopsis xylanica]|uniref:Enterochelin esterase n=1 Tax=Amycolatopsis xylanica TaxID=589385 RepID=A0A1H3K0X4_9PSEU|nr:Enterochelin esterase [Amycolatopsis xylanica]